MIIEQTGRALIQVEDQEYWDKLPKDVKGIPVYYRFTATGIDLWPMWNMYEGHGGFYPDIRVSP